MGFFPQTTGSGLGLHLFVGRGAPPPRPRAGPHPHAKTGLRPVAAHSDCANRETRTANPRPSSVFRLLRVDLVDPGEDAALQVLGTLEALLPEELRRLGAAAAHLALHHNRPAFRAG